MTLSGTSAQLLQSPFLNGQTSSLWNACNDANSIPSGGFAGRTNWRVPTRDELVSIVDYDRIGGPIINITFFPNTFSSGYWTSSSVSTGATNAWYLRFGDGEVDTKSKSVGTINAYVRCVSR